MHRTPGQQPAAVAAHDGAGRDQRQHITAADHDVPDRLARMPREPQVLGAVHRPDPNGKYMPTDSLQPNGVRESRLKARGARRVLRSCGAAVRPKGVRLQLNAEEPPRETGDQAKLDQDRALRLCFPNPFHLPYNQSPWLFTNIAAPRCSTIWAASSARSS